MSLLHFGVLVEDAHYIPHLLPAKQEVFYLDLVLDEFNVGLVEEPDQLDLQAGGVEGPHISILLKRLHFVKLVLQE